MNCNIERRIKAYKDGEAIYGYKNSEIGLLPDDWSITTVERIAQIGTGNRDTKDRVDNGEYPFFVRSQNEERINTYSYDGEAVLTAGDGVGVGKVFHYIVGKFDYHQRVYKISDFDNYCGRFFFEYFKVNFIKEAVKYNAKSSVDSVRRDMIAKMKIPVPSINEQSTIAEILKTWDRAIELKEKLIEEKKNQKTSIVRSLLSKKKRLLGYNDKWKTVRLGDYLIKHNEKSTENNQYPVLTSSRNGIFFQKDYFDGNDVASKDNTGYNVVPRGYFTYRHMSDDLIFKFNINTLADRGIVSTLYPVFTTKSELDSKFLKLVLNEGLEFKRYALSQKQGGSRTYMYYSKLEELEIKIPSIEEQLAISNFEQIAQKEMELLENELGLLKQQKKGLMQLLLTGIVRVNTQEN